MSDSCFKKNDLIIAGTRLDERFPEALDPSFVLPDERSIADLLVFISNFSGLLNYYALSGDDQQEYKTDGTWKPLIQSDEAFNYAGISITPFSLPNKTFYKYVNLYETGSTGNRRNAAFRVLWDVLFSVYKDINTFYTALPVYMPLRSEVAAEINNGLITDFKLAAGAYLNDSVAIPSVDLQISTDPADDEYKFRFAQSVISGDFDIIWIDKLLAPSATAWNQYITALKASPDLAKSFFNFTGLAQDFDRIDYSTLQLKQIFKRAFEAYARIIAKANGYLQNSLQNNSSHFAHHGLMLAFLKLFGVLQADMNEFTRKHLEYYYNRVLQINPAPAVPDSAHIVFDPAKNTHTHLIAKNTPLNAGKDATGRLLLYNTDNEIVISQAKVEQLKTVYLEPGKDGKITRVYASAIANSMDGKGADFNGPDTSWKGFGDIRLDPVTKAEINTAQLGFYIASPVLHLTEGKRIINFVFSTDASGFTKANKIASQDFRKLFLISFSGEKQWETLIIEDTDVTGYNCHLEYSANPADNSFTIQLTLFPDCKPLVGFDASVCDGNLDTIFPVVKFVLNQDLEQGAYESFRDISISKINIIVEAQDMTGLSLQNDLGMADASKPVQPFGPIPKKNSSFYIGHPELEHKLITSFNIYLQWLDLNPNLETYYSYTHPKLSGAIVNYITESYVPGVTSNNSFLIKTDFLRNKEWRPGDVPEDSLFKNGPIPISFSGSPLKAASDKPLSYKNGSVLITTGTQNGFLRLTLSAPADAFGHSLWPMLFAQQTVALTNDPNIAHNTIPKPPYTPLLQSVKLNYSAAGEINFTEDKYKPEDGQFSLLMPFGIKEENQKVTLLPVFKLQKKAVDGTMSLLQAESAVFVGISHAEINQSISLLLQMNEGTEDISVNTPDVTWNYLSKEGWKNFDQKFLADSTSGLLKPGIIKFQVPGDINKGTTELPADLLWIMAAVEHKDPVNKTMQVPSNGLPKILAIYGNAVKATFADHGNDPEHLGTALPANSISKLYIADSAVKKVNQPFASFGGKKIEEGSKFYTKVSERLRHKHRAITIWDYERLVLNEFNEVYMVKCLNHTGYQKDCKAPAEKGHYKENLPGNVLLVPVPFVTNLQAGNIFQPALSAAKLADIKNFIHGSDSASSCNKNANALHCQLATLVVENPLYETIQVNCKIMVKDCLDQLFYKVQLVEDLNKFLSPWINGDAAKINFGGKLHASQVIYFIEQLDYIDYVTNLTIEHKSGDDVLNANEPSLAVASTSRSVLTSFGSHIINNA